MTGYQTYVVGPEAMLLNALRQWWKDSEIRIRVYESNWRVLHIDGLDGIVCSTVSYKFTYEATSHGNVR